MQGKSQHHHHRNPEAKEWGRGREKAEPLPQLGFELIASWSRLHRLDHSVTTTPCKHHTQEIIGRKLVVVPDLNHEDGGCVELRLIQTPEVLLFHAESHTHTHTHTHTHMHTHMHAHTHTDTQTPLKTCHFHSHH